MSFHTPPYHYQLTAPNHPFYGSVGGSGLPSIKTMTAQIEFSKTEFGLSQFKLTSSEGIEIGESISAFEYYLMEQIASMKGDELPLPMFELEETPDYYPCWNKEYYLMTGFRLAFYDDAGEECFCSEIVDHEDLLGTLAWVVEHEIHRSIIDYD